MITVEKSWSRIQISAIRLRTNVTWAEVGLWTIVVLGSLLGTLKRYVPGPAIMITIGYDVLCFGLLAYVILKRLLHSRIIPYSSITPPLFIFIAYVALTIINPQLTSLSRGLLGWRFLASSLLLHYLGFYIFDTPQRIWRFLTIMWSMGLIVGLYGIVQLVRGYTAIELAWVNDLAATMRVAGTGRYRLMSTLGSAVDLGFFLSLTAPSLFAVLLTQKYRSWMRFSLFIIVILVLLFTYVRAAWVAVGLSCIYLAVIQLWYKPRFRLLLPSFFAVVVASLILLPYFITIVTPHIQDAALQERIGSLAEPLADKSMLDRFSRWSDVWEVVEEYPLGIGVGMTGATSLRFLDELGPASITMDNSYLKVLVETGWIGLGLYVWLLLLIIGKGAQLIRKLKGEFRLLAMIFTACFVAFIIIQFFGEYVELNPARSFIWMLSGFLFSLPRLQATQV